MSRLILNQEKLASEALNFTSNYHLDVVKEVAEAIEKNKIVVVGMAGNMYVKNARKALKSASKEFKYLEYGSYVSAWQSRLAIKMWSGWPTFPQVFVDGKLIGGFRELKIKLDKREI